MTMEEKTGRKGISGTAIKRVACVSMLLDHLAASWLQVDAVSRLVQGAGTAAERDALFAGLMQLAFVLRKIGRPAFPLYTFLLVEGFIHTRDVRRYGLRLLVFAVLSEIPFDMAFYRTPFEWGAQNVYWTLALGLLALVLVRRFAGGDIKHDLLCLGSVAVCALAAEGMKSDYGAFGVILIVTLYLLRNDKRRQTLCGVLLTAWEVTGPLAFVLTWFYTGRRGHCAAWEKYAFYAFYPLHLALLACFVYGIGVCG